MVRDKSMLRGVGKLISTPPPPPKKAFHRIALFTWILKLSFSIRKHMWLEKKHILVIFFKCPTHSKGE